jgi:hypothetical protein
VCYASDVADRNWQSLEEMWKDMSLFAESHPDYVFLSSDRPLLMGFVAFREDGEGEERRWAIGLATVRRTLSGLPPVFRELFKKPAGRQLLCSQLTGKQTLCNPMLGV